MENQCLTKIYAELSEKVICRIHMYIHLQNKLCKTRSSDHEVMKKEKESAPSHLKH